jgi:predicted ArsR family transcriptional regulator
MESLGITEAELFDALAAATGEGPDDARTAQEMADGAGISVPRVRRALQQLARAGRLESHRVRRADLSGRHQLVPAYTVRPA